MTNEKVLELSTQILTALIAEQFIPVAAVGKSCDHAAAAIEDCLYAIAKKVKEVHVRLEEDGA